MSLNLNPHNYFGQGTKWNVLRIECTKGQTSFEIHILIPSTFYLSWFQNFTFILIFFTFYSKMKMKMSLQRDKDIVIQKCNFKEGFVHHIECCGYAGCNGICGLVC